MYKNSTTIFDLTDEEIDIYLKELFIKQLVEISLEVKYSERRSKKKKKRITKSLLKSIRLIEENSLDITHNYTCVPFLGLTLADEYGENARGCFHKICKNNKQYNLDTCDKEYSNYLKVESKLMGMVPFYYLLTESYVDELNTLINENSKTSKL